MEKKVPALILAAVIVVAVLLYASGLLSGKGFQQSPTASSTTGPAPGNSSASSTVPPGPYISEGQAADLIGPSGNYSVKECISTEHCSNTTFSGTLWTVDYRITGSGSRPLLYETLFNSTSARDMYSSALHGLPTVTESSTYEGMEYAYYTQALKPPYEQFLHMIALKDTYFASISIVTGSNSSVIDPPALLAALAGELP